MNSKTQKLKKLAVFCLSLFFLVFPCFSLVINEITDVYKQKSTIIHNSANKSGYMADKKGVGLQVGEKKKEEKKDGCKC